MKVIPGVNSPDLGNTMTPQEKIKELAPKWLQDRMNALRKMPSPTLEEVRTQYKASMKTRANALLIATGRMR